MLQYRTESRLAQAKVCFLTAPQHYLAQLWLIICKDLCHSPGGNFTWNADETNLLCGANEFKQNSYENYSSLQLCLFMDIFWSSTNEYINSLAPGRFEWYFGKVILKLISIIGSNVFIAKLPSDEYHWTALGSTLVLVMVWCRQAQAIIWTNVESDLCRSMASLGQTVV